MTEIYGSKRKDFSKAESNSPKIGFLGKLKKNIP